VLQTALCTPALIQGRCTRWTRQTEISSGNFASGGTVIDGPSIVDGTLYWGSGYRNIQGTGNNKVYAFSLAGEKDHGEHPGDNDDHNHNWTVFE